MPRPGSATPATKNPDKKQGRRRPSRHCSWGRWPRFSQLAFGPHPSRHGYECIDSSPAPAFSKKTFGETPADTVESVFLHRPGGSGVSDPRLQKNRGARATTLGPQIRNDYAGKFTSRRGLGTYFAKSLEQRTGFYLGDSTRWRTSAGARQRAPSRRETSRSREAGKLPSGLGSG